MAVAGAVAAETRVTVGAGVAAVMPLTRTKTPLLIAPPPFIVLSQPQSDPVAPPLGYLIRRVS